MLALVLVGGGSYALVPEAQRKAPPAARGAVATPTAMLSLSGKKIPNAEVSYTPPGDYELAVEAQGYESAKQKVKVEGDVVILRIHLKAAPGAETAPPPGPGTSTPPTATGPGTSTSPGPGTSTVPPGKTPEPAPPSTFTAQFVSTPPGAEIRLDGKLIGSTPKAKATKLSQDKEYKYTAKLAGYRTYEGTLKGDGKAEAQVEIQLERDAKDAQRDRERRKGERKRRSGSGTRAGQGGKRHGKRVCWRARTAPAGRTWWWTEATGGDARPHRQAALHRWGARDRVPPAGKTSGSRA